MQVFLQHNTSRMFLAPNGTWVSEDYAALHFQNTLAALDYLVHHRVNGAQILVRLEDKRRGWQVMVFPGPSPMSNGLETR